MFRLVPPIFSVSPPNPIRVAVLVLGDLGRSPRMQYQALALAESGAEVDLIGYGGSPLDPSLGSHPRLRCHLARRPARLGVGRPGLLRLVRASLGLAAQTIGLCWLLVARIRRPDFLLVQTPPAVPSLLVGLVSARLRGARLVIDWHNLGFTLLSLQLGSSHPLVALYRGCERILGGCGDFHLCVSRRLKEELEGSWGAAEAVLLYDAPRRRLPPPSARRCRHLMEDLLERFHAPRRGTAVIVSSTSWTPDEDFDVLAEAIQECRSWIDEPDFPHLLFLITGRGALRPAFEERIPGLSGGKIHIGTLWLDPLDYFGLLASADLGLCLHRSSSGLDLPMKLSDMLGSGIPVVALDYGPCLRERIRPGENGLLFGDAPGLSEQLRDCFRGFPGSSARLDRLRRGVFEEEREGWEESWKRRAGPIFGFPA